MKTIYYNPLDVFYKSVTGAVTENNEITFRVKGFDSVVFVCERDSGETREIAMTNKGDYCECSACFTRGLYWYCFRLSDGRFIVEKNMLGVISHNPERKFQLTAYSHDFVVPKWIYGGIIYQIFPDRFNFCGKEPTLREDRILHKNLSDTPYFLPDENGKVKNNDFFGGNIKGIIEKIPYLQELGVSVIYLNPIFEAYSNHRYDTGDYLKIDEYLGDENDFKELVDKAEKAGIKLVLDGVFNHTGDDSVYFNKYGRYLETGAYQSKNSKYYEWYKFIRHPDLYESWWGVDVLPATNKNNDGFINFITGENGVMDKYTKNGIGGWRLDVVDELPPHFVKAIRSRVKSVNPDAIIIGEVWEDASNKISYGIRREYFQGDELDSVMNYPLKNAIIDFIKSRNVNKLALTVKEQIDHYPEQVLHALMNILATHDTFRLLSALGEKDVSKMSKSEMQNVFLSGNEYENAVKKLKLAVFLQYTLYGVPSVYYGDEIGMQGYADPLNRKFFDWQNIDESIRDFYVKIGEIRRSYSCFISGEVKIVYEKNGCFAFKRSDGNSEVLVAVNVDDNECILEFDGELTEILRKENFYRSATLKKDEFGIFLKKSN